MIKELLSELHINLRSVVGDGSIFVLYIASVILIISVFSKGSQRMRGVILSIPAAVATAVSIALERVFFFPFKNRLVKYAAAAFAACLCLLAIASSGKSVFSKELCERAENDMHLPKDMERAMTSILEEDDAPHVLVPYKWGAYFNAYSSRFTVVYDDPETSGSDRQTLTEQLESIRPDMEKVTGIAHKRGCTYAVIPDGIWPEVPIDKCGYELMIDCDGCNVYREVKTSR